MDKTLALLERILDRQTEIIQRIEELEKHSHKQPDMTKMLQEAHKIVAKETKEKKPRKVTKVTTRMLRC